MKPVRAWALAALLLAGCQQAADAPRAGAEPVRRSIVVVDPALVAQGRITLATVVVRRADVELRAIGYVEPDVGAAADVGALVLSRVRTVEVREGDRVEAGQTLATLDTPDAARLAGELTRARARRARAEAALARERRLIASQATSRSDLEQAEAELQSQSAEERATRLLLASYGASGSVVRVLAPIRGVVAHVGTVLGARVQAGDELFRIVDPEHLVVRAEVLERDAPHVALGAQARLLLPEARTCSAVAVARGAEVERSRHTVSMRLEPRGCAGLIAGQVLDVRVFSATSDAAPLAAVPRDALVDIDGTPVVFTAGALPGQFKLFPVLPARVTETFAFLEKAPPPGTSVVSTGAILLKGEWLRASLE